jgi:hypothetical protein
MNGDAAEEVVRMAVNGADVAIRLVGAGAKNLALLLLAWSRNEKVHAGKTSLPKLLSSGDELHVLSLSKEEYSAFKKQAGKKITYAPFLNTKNKDGKVDVVVGLKQEGIVNRILNRIGYQDIKAGSGARAEILNDREKEELGMSFGSPSGDSKKNDTPSRRSSNECRDSSRRKDGPKGSKPSVEKQLEENKRKLERENKKQKDRTREKNRSKQKSKSKGKDR